MSKVYGRGGLTDEDRDRIDELVAQGKKATTIAREIQRHPATVHWYMYTQGHVTPTYDPKRPKSYVRNGRTVHFFSPEEDALIQSLRKQNYTLRRIAEAATERFHTQRSAHAIKVRLMMLAAREDAALP